MKNQRARKKKKVAVITGGSSGIGWATAGLLVKEGWYVIIADCNEPLFPYDRDCLFWNDRDRLFWKFCDVRSESLIKNIFPLVQKKFGGLDFLMTSAGVHSAKSIEETTEQEYDRLADVNMKGTFFATREAIPLMKQGGCIVTVSSDAGLIPDPDAVLYSASKHWVIGYTTALALRLVKRGIRVNCICPGQTDTPFLRNVFGNDADAIAKCAAVNPTGRLAQPKEVAEVIIYGMLYNNYVNGAVWNVDGGYSYQPMAEPPKAKN